jgi:hypothetical protein
MECWPDSGPTDCLVVNDDDRAGFQDAREKDLANCRRAQANHAIRQAYVNFARTDPETALQVAQEHFGLNAVQVRVVRTIDQPGAEAMILELAGVLVCFGHGLDEDEDATFHLLVQCPSCEGLVAQGTALYDEFGLRMALDEPRDTVLPHTADAPPDTKLLQSTSRSIFWDTNGARTLSIGDALCEGVGHHVDVV